MLKLTQFVLRRAWPQLCGLLTAFLYHGKNVTIGRNFRADAVPRILIDESSTLRIGKDVELRHGVEIRVHQSASVVIEEGVRIDRGVRILAANSAVVRLCRGARIGLYSVMNGGDSITVGERALVSGFVYLQTSMHGHSNSQEFIQAQGYRHSPITLGADVWIGAHAVILPGCNLGHGAIVGSNAVVTESVPDRVVVAGVPARVLRDR